MQRAFIFFLPLIILGCGKVSPSQETIPTVDAASTEAREDSLALVAAFAGQSLIIPAVTAKVETASAKATALADAADDPAIWVHPTDRSKSLIFGSNKTGGLAVYDLTGNEVAYYPLGNVNNVDILRGVKFGDTTIDILGCSNRSDQSIDLFRIDAETGELTDIASGVLSVDTTKIDDVYGFCLGRDVVKGRDYAIWNGKNGMLQQAELLLSEGAFSLRIVRELRFPSQTEGMVTDNELGWLYVGEESAGVWKLPLVPVMNEGSLPQEMHKIPEARVGDNSAMVADVEGIALVETGTKSGYLVVSVQGNFSYAVFDREGDNGYLGSFKITDGPICDGVEETDGLEVVPDELPGFPRGVLVAQDGFNYDGGKLQPQNFKFIDWGEVLAAIKAVK